MGEDDLGFSIAEFVVTRRANFLLHRIRLRPREVQLPVHALGTVRFGGYTFVRTDEMYLVEGCAVTGTGTGMYRGAVMMKLPDTNGVTLRYAVHRTIDPKEGVHDEVDRT